LKQGDLNRRRSINVVAMTPSPPPTVKGARQADEVLSAALRCLGRDGFAATSLSRVAVEAGVSKRMVLYYFDSRADLFNQLAQLIGGRLLSQLEEGMAGMPDSDAVVGGGFEGVWSAITADRALLIALFGIMIESVTDDQLSQTVNDFKQRFRDLLKRQMEIARAHGHEILIDDDVAATLIMSGFLGLALEWLERGDTPALTAAIASYQAGITALTPLV
jgi:AcrR family transcriptional regulator